MGSGLFSAQITQHLCSTIKKCTKMSFLRGGDKEPEHEGKIGEDSNFFNLRF